MSPNDSQPGADVAQRRLLQAIVEMARIVFGAAAASVFLVDPANGDLVFEAVAGEGEGQLPGTRFPGGTGIAGWAAMYGQPVLIDDVSDSQQFARDAAGALTLALRMASCADQNDQLRSSIVSRAVIDQALGVIMATERCPQDKAFAMLRSVSQNTNVKLRDLAASIVTRVSGEPPRLTAPFEDG